MRKSNMATILLYKTYKFTYLHPQINSVWTEYVQTTVYPTTKMPHILVYVCLVEYPGSENKC